MVAPPLNSFEARVPGVLCLKFCAVKSCPRIRRAKESALNSKLARFSQQPASHPLSAPMAASASLVSSRCLASASAPIARGTQTTNSRPHAGSILPRRRIACKQSLDKASYLFKCNRPGLSGVPVLPRRKGTHCALQTEKQVSVKQLEKSVSGNEKHLGQRVNSHPGDAYFATDKRPIILFDGVCNLCNTGVNFMLDHDPKGNLRFSALQSEAGRALLRRAGRDPKDITSIVLVEPNKCYIRSEAILHIAQYLHQPLITLGKLGLFFPGFFRDRFYNLIAYNRYSIMGKRNMCRIGDTRFTDRFVN